MRPRSNGCESMGINLVWCSRLAPAISKLGFRSVLSAWNLPWPPRSPGSWPTLTEVTWPAPTGVIWDGWPGSPTRNHSATRATGTLPGCDSCTRRLAWRPMVLCWYRPPSERYGSPPAPSPLPDRCQVRSPANWWSPHPAPARRPPTFTRLGCSGCGFHNDSRAPIGVLPTSGSPKSCCGWERP